MSERLTDAQVRTTARVLEAAAARRAREAAAMAEADAEADAPGVVHHNHTTRDIKPPGQCPACDKYHERGRTGDAAPPD